VTGSGHLILRYDHPRHRPANRSWLKPAAGVVLLALVVGAGYLVWRRGMPAVEVAPPRVERGSSGVAIVTGRATLAARTVLVYPKVPGRVADLLFAIGSNVRLAQVVGHLENVAEGRAASLADSALNAARTALTNAQLVPDEAARREAVRAATARLTEANARAIDARRRLEQTYITSPLEGRVVRRLVALGERVGPPGRPGARAVAEVMDLPSLRAVGDVAVGSGVTIRVDDPARIRLDSVRGRWYRGSVRRVTAGPGGTLRVEAGVNAPDARSRPGFEGVLEVTAHAATGQVSARIFVPTGAVHRDAGQTVVWLVQGDRVVRRTVDAAPEAGGWREIRAGLDGGELVVVRGPAELVPGARVRATNARGRSPGAALTPSGRFPG
jgi:RND family efflux transporter MFP subunit